MKIIFQTSIDLNDLSEVKNKVLYGIQSYSTFAYLDNNLYHNQPNRYELLVGLGVQKIVPVNEIHLYPNEWLFGHLTYDYKNELYPKLYSSNESLDDFDSASFFVPEMVIALQHNSNILEFYGQVEDADTVALWWDKILKSNTTSTTTMLEWNEEDWSELMSQQQYLSTVNMIKNHIVEGDCYELNLCNAYSRKYKNVDIPALFKLLNDNNAAPFAALYRRNNQYVLCTSPERYIFKDQSHIISQPIKGTIKRGASVEENELLKEQLKLDIKERAENVMITDLVRNDLAQICKVGSIQVPELFGVYTFQSLNHLISTITGELLDGVTLFDSITKPFPMGSMTGAPKYIVMQLIEQYENFKRGIYSGSIGYIDPFQNFDFNVVIRSVVLDADTSTLSFHAGGAIVYDSVPEKEWEELQLKAQRNKQLLRSVSK